MIICPNKSNPDVAREFNEIKDAIEAISPGKGEIAAYLIWSLNNGNGIDKAPNGAESILFNRLLREYKGNRTKAIQAKAKVYGMDFLAWFGDWTGNYEDSIMSDRVKKVISNDKKIRLLLDTHTDENPREIVLDPQGNNKYYVHTRTWDGDHIPANMSNADKLQLFNALYKELPIGAEILIPKSSKDYYATRGAVAAMQRLYRDKRFSPGQKGSFEYKDKKGEKESIKTYSGTGFIKTGFGAVSRVTDENGEPKIVYHGTDSYGFDVFDPLKSDDKISLFTSDSKYIASTYTKHRELGNLLRQRLLEGNAIDLIKNKKFDDIVDIIKNTIDRSHNITYWEENDVLYSLSQIYEELKNPDLLLDEVYALYDLMSKIEDSVYKIYDAKIEHVEENKRINRQEYYKLKVKDLDRDDGSYFIDKTTIFDGNINDFTDSILFDTKIYSLFENIKNPLIVDNQKGEFGASFNWNELYFNGKVWKTRDLAKFAKDGGHDGVIFKDIIDHGPYSHQERFDFPVTDADIAYDYKHEGEDSYTGGNIYASNIYISFDPNQLKSATNNNGQFYKTDNSIYHNQRDFNFEEESRKYYQWFYNAKQKLNNALDSTHSKQIKDNLVQEFNSLGFKHFEIHPKMNKLLMWYLSTKNSIDRKDFRDVLEIAKKISYTESGIQTIPSDKILPLLKYIFSQIHGENHHWNDLCNILYAKLKDGGVKIQFVEDTFRDSPAYYDHETGVISINTNGVFVNSNGFDNVVAQTLLHELLHAVTVETIKHSPELRRDLETLFNKVKSSAAVKAYFAERAYGLTDIYEFLAELSNEDFVRVLLNIHTGSESKPLFNQVIDFLKKVANSILSRINKEWKGTAYADAMEILLKASLPETFDVKIQSTPVDDQTIFKAISNRQQAALDESQRLIVRMNVLHRQYEKIKDKTISLQKIADRIFETLNKLKQNRNIAAVGIALEQAKLSLGLYDQNTGGPATMQTANIYSFLYNAKLNNFDGVLADQLVDMYRNTIKFYSDLIAGIPSEQVIDLSNEDKNNITELKGLIENHIMPLWIEAIMKVSDDIVDALIDQEVESSEENREEMKKVAKDWLHKNMMYGDITAFTSYVYNYSYSSNPIIKQAFHLIQHAEQQTLEEMHHIAPRLMKAYLVANKNHSYTPGWLSIMMEFDDKGIPTGNFIRELNYGLYQKDLNDFINTLNSDFIDDYGYTYVTDDTGAVVNSLTNEFADDEEWGPNGEMPNYVKYQLAIEKFKSDRVHRRFTGRYYIERLSRPYNGTIDPLSPEFKDTRFHHGLSPKTLRRYNYYQSNINYYLNKCQDLINGLVYPERLEKEDKRQLEMWTEKLDKFSNIFNEDGSYKMGEDLKMAYEIRAWLKWMGLNTDSEYLQDMFNAELNEAYQKSISENNPAIYQDFLKFNASVGINPDFIKLTVGSLRSGKPDTDLSTRGKLLRASLLNQVEMLLNYSRRLGDKVNNPLFWLRCKSSDQNIEDSRDPNKKGGWTKDQVEAYQKNFYDRNILYIDANGFYIDENGNSVSPNDPNLKQLEESGSLLTFRLYLINLYTNEAFLNGLVVGLIDESTGNPVDFSGLTLDLIRSHITEMLSYTRRTFHEDGSVTESKEPLTIFLMLTPSNETFFNKRTGKTERIIVYLGERRFKDSTSTFTDPVFNPNEGVAEKPNSQFDNGRYDNSEAYNEITSDPNVADLYDTLIDAMTYAQSIYSTNRTFNYKLPQINAHTTALFSRILKRGYTTKALQSIWNSISTIEENDEDMRTKQDYFIGVDGEIANDVPLKFIRNLKNPENISTDLVSSVILFVDMALNYKNKSGIDATLKLLRYNMDPENRQTYDDKLKQKSEPAANSNKQSIKMYDSMMDTLMYGNKYGDKDNGGPSKTTVAVQKTADAFLSLESSAMLGLNMFSMSVGFADSITRILLESAAGKYMTTGDCLWALGICLYYTPKCIANMFNPLANNKLSALMLMNGISKGTYGTYVKADWGKGRKFLSNMLMGGWSMLDWMANALLMTAFYHNCRLYEGLKDDNGNYIIEKGFYTKYELLQAFLRAGRTKSEANSAHHNLGQLGSRITLWDAYEFAPYYTDADGHTIKMHGEVHVRPEYEQYVTLKIKTRIATKTKKRGALYNGMNPDNDVPRWKRDVIGRLVGALRGWIVQLFQHLVAGGTDSVAREFYTDVKYETTSSGTRAVPKLKKRKLTDEQRSRMQAWDYETGTTLDQILIGLWRSFKTLYKEAQQALLQQPKTAKLSEVEKYAWKDTIIFLSMLALMMVGWTYVHDDARTVQPPKNRLEAGPATLWNPIDYYTYMRDVYIPNQYWKLAVDDIYFRTVESKISNINPQQVLDIVSSLTALKSGLDDQLGIIGIATDLINGEDNNEILKQGAYKFYTKGDRVLYRAIGPAKNLHTALTYYGATNNLRWYTNKFGVFYRAFGYDFKAKDEAANKAKSSYRGFGGGNFSGGNFSEGNFNGGNFSSGF